MNKWLNHRFLYFLAFVLVLCLLGGAKYLQDYKGVIPCPLCMLQRFVFIALAVVFLLGVLVAARRWGQIAIGILGSLFSIAGIFLAGRQVWLQYNPSNNSDSCEVSLEYMLKVLPFDQVLAKVFQGGSGCSKIGWDFFGVSLAQWSLLFFVLFLFFSLWQLRPGHPKH